MEHSPAVKKVDNAIHRINLCPVDSAIGFANTYPLDNDLSGGQSYASFEQPGLNSETDSGSVYEKKIPGFLNSDYRTPRISITDSIIIWITVHLGYPLLTVL